MMAQELPNCCCYVCRRFLLQQQTVPADMCGHLCTLYACSDPYGPSGASRFAAAASTGGPKGWGCCSRACATGQRQQQQ
jgi:hypothetical protein